MTLRLKIADSKEAIGAGDSIRELGDGRLTIGRGPNNDWVLPDPDRHLSKQHCVIEGEAGNFTLTDTSTNGVYVNDSAEPLGRGNSIRLSGEDRLRLGDFEFKVDLKAPQKAPQKAPRKASGPAASEERSALFEEDTFAAIISGKGSAGEGGESEENLSDPDEEFRDARQSSSRPWDEEAPDPFAEEDRFGNDPRSYDSLSRGDESRLRFEEEDAGGPGRLLDDRDPWDDSSEEWEGGTQSDHAASPEESFRPPNVSGDAIPDDWDDLLEGMEEDAPAGAGAGQGAEPRAAPSGEADKDDLDDLLGPDRPPRRESDDLDDLMGPGTGPGGEAAATPPEGNDDLDDLDDLLGEEAPRPDPAPEPEPSPPEEPPRRAAETVASTVPRREAPPERGPEQVPERARPARSPGGDPAIDAFLAGCGLDPQVVGERLDEDAMRRVGETFLALVSGLREVLMARSSVKNELRVERTTIGSQNNNPLKFSVNEQEAILALLLQDRSGFMAALPSVEEGFKDVQAHQLAVMAGMQSALTALLKEFDPEHLKEKLTRKSSLGSLLPMSKKAQYWELYEQLYKEIARDAEDSFQGRFGREFARAYEEQQGKL